MSNRVSSSDLMFQYKAILARVQAGERLIVEHDGQPVVALVPVEDVDRLAALPVTSGPSAGPADDVLADLDV